MDSNVTQTTTQTSQVSFGLLAPPRLLQRISTSGLFWSHSESRRLEETGNHRLHRPTTADAVRAMEVKGELIFQFKNWRFKSSATACWDDCPTLHNWLNSPASPLEWFQTPSVSFRVCFPHSHPQESRVRQENSPRLRCQKAARFRPDYLFLVVFVSFAFS